MSNIDNMMNFADAISNDENLAPLMNVIEEIMAFPEDKLNESSIDMISGMINGAFTPKVKEDAIQEMVKSFQQEGHSHTSATSVIEMIKQGMTEIITDLKPSAMKKKLLDSVFDCFYEIFDGALERYHSYDIVLPIKLDNGGRIPTYAHESDACADVYASEDCVVPAHSISVAVHTGLHIALPEGWQARVAPRSSTGFKTPLRQSNSIGIIDSKQKAFRWVI